MISPARSGERQAAEQDGEEYRTKEVRGETGCGVIS